MKNTIINAAINGRKGYKGFGYFFNGRQYLKYDWKNEKPVPGYPKNLSLWNLPGNFRNGIDAAINGEKRFLGSVYFFKGKEYVKYDWSQSAVMPGYPKPLSEWKLPGSFAHGVDAACNGRKKYAGFGYFFKNGEYVKYDWEKDDPVPGYPKPISQWNLPLSFQSGVDAVINGVGKYKRFAYFFKGSEYVSYDWETNKTSKIKSIRGPWKLNGIWEKGTPTSNVIKKALLVFIENTGQLPLPSGTPKWIEDNLESVADTFFEEIEKAINSFEDSQGSLYDKVIMLEDSTAVFSELKSQLHDLGNNGYEIDIIIQAHGNASSFSGLNHASITDADIESIGTSFGKPLPIRAVYQMNCSGSGLNDEWRKIGAQAVSGAHKNNYFPEPLMSSFWNNWKSGETFENSVNGAYSDLGGYLKLIMAVSTSVTDAYTDSKPVISGNGKVRP